LSGIVVYEEQDVGQTKIIVEEFGYMIKDGFRGKGIGTKIYELVFEEAKKLGIKRLHDTIKIDQPIPFAFQPNEITIPPSFRILET